MKITFAQVVGLSQAQLWSQVVVFPGVVAVGEGREEKLVVVLKMRGKGAEERGGVVVGKIEKDLVELGIEGAVKNLMKNQVAPKDMEFMMVHFGDGGEVKIYGWGRGKVVISREGEFGEVYEAKMEKWSGLRGQWREGDRWLIGTNDLIDEMSEQLLKEVLVELPSGEAGDELGARVYGASENAGVAGVLVSIEDEEKSEVQLPQVDEEEVDSEENSIDQVEQGFEPKVYLKKRDTRRKKALILGALLLIILMGSIGWGSYQRQKMGLETSYANIEQQVGDKLQEAESLGRDNPIRAMQLLEEVEGLLSAAKTEFEGKEDYLIRLNEWEGKIAQTKIEISGEEKIGEAPVWYELSLIQESLYGEKMVSTGKALVIVDAKQGLVGRIGLEQKSGELVGGGELLGGLGAVAAVGDRAVALSDRGLIDIDMSRKTTAVLVEAEAEWRKPVAVGLFGGNVYLADAEAGEIWRYPATESGMGSRQRWFGEQVTPNLGELKDMTIDGDIWLGMGSGEVQRYRRGRRENFRIQGLQEELGDVRAIETSEESEYIYALLPSQQRVVQIDKEGNYEKQWNWNGLAAATDLVVDEERGLILVLSGKTIYSLEL